MKWFQSLSFFVGICHTIDSDLLHPSYLKPTELNPSSDSDGVDGLRLLVQASTSSESQLKSSSTLSKSSKSYQGPSQAYLDLHMMFHSSTTLRKELIKTESRLKSASGSELDENGMKRIEMTREILDRLRICHHAILDELKISKKKRKRGRSYKSTASGPPDLRSSSSQAILKLISMIYADKGSNFDHYHIYNLQNLTILMTFYVLKDSYLITPQHLRIANKIFKSPTFLRWIAREFRDIYEPGSLFDNRYHQSPLSPDILEDNFNVPHLRRLYQDLSKTEQELVWLFILHDKIRVIDLQLDDGRSIEEVEHVKLPSLLRCLMSLIESLEIFLIQELNQEVHGDLHRARRDKLFSEIRRPMIYACDYLVESSVRFGHHHHDEEQQFMDRLEIDFMIVFIILFRRKFGIQSIIDQFVKGHNPDQDIVNRFRSDLDRAELTLNCYQHFMKLMDLKYYDHDTRGTNFELSPTIRKYFQGKPYDTAIGYFLRHLPHLSNQKVILGDGGVLLLRSEKDEEHHDLSSSSSPDELECLYHQLRHDYECFEEVIE